MTVSIIILNTIVFLFELKLSPKELESLFYLFGIVPARFSHPIWAAIMGFPLDNYWPFLTSMFLHGGWIHFLGNMWALWLFGDNVEERMGHFRFLLFYLLCGLIAGIVHYLFNINSTIPTIGASGAIAGVMGAYFLLFPHSRVITLVPIFFFIDIWEIPAFFYFIIWFLIQVFSGILSLTSSNVYEGIAFWAHVGGFISGIITFSLFLKPRRRYRKWFDDETVYNYPYHFFWR